MNAGLPGTGIGGLFYIMGALWMPVDALLRAATGRDRAARWGTIARQSGMAVAILLSLWGTGWLLGLLLAPAVPAPVPGGTGAAGAEAVGVVSAVRWATVLGSIGVLAAVVATVQVLRLLVPRHRRSPQPVDIGPAGLAIGPPAVEIAEVA